MAWLKDNFDNFFSAFLIDNSTNAVTSIDSLRAIRFDDTYAGQVIDFEVAAFDVRASTLRLDIVMSAVDYVKADALFVTPNMKLDSLS